MPEGFAMECWHDAGWRNAQGKRYAEPGWTRMDREGDRTATWRPRGSARDAAAKCLAWTGGIGIPTMRVVDLATGEVVWQWGADDDVHAGAGAPILPPWDAQAREDARAQLGHRVAPAPMRPVRTVQTRLF